MKPDRVLRIDRLKIAVFDSFLDARALKALSAEVLGEARGGPSRPYHPVTHAAIRGNPATRRLADRLGELAGRSGGKRRQHELASAVLNVLTHDEPSRIHRDFARCPDCVSFILFLNPRWKPEWGGELVFYDGRADARHCVTPKPGRLVMFAGNLVHRAGNPSPECPMPRLTLGLWHICRQEIARLRRSAPRSA